MTSGTEQPRSPTFQVQGHEADDEGGYVKADYCFSFVHAARNFPVFRLLFVIAAIVNIFIIGATFMSSRSNILPSTRKRITLPAAATSAVDSNYVQRSTTKNQRDLFLLSGQSNMIGHTTSKQSITSTDVYWNTIKSIVESGDLGMMEENLHNVIYETNFFNEQVATTLTNGLMELYKSLLLKDLDTPLSLGKCSFKEASESSNGIITVDDVSQGTVPIKWDANCGRIFGHELLFSRTLELEMSYTNEFEMHKVARGGSEIFEHWYPNHGLHWNLLKEAIEERKGEGVDWKGFIWHQGSQEAWSEREYGEDRSLYYYGNLTGLVNEVRTLMFENSASYWQCKEEIPVVIVQVGYWPSDNQLSQRVRDAQARLCDEDPRAVMVKSNDLSQNYHYDAPSFLISGNRIAHAYQEALGGVVECPSGSPILTSIEPTISPFTTGDNVITPFPGDSVVLMSSEFGPKHCDDSTSKIFKLTLKTDTYSNTSWTLYEDSWNIYQSNSNLDKDSEYTERICVIPNYSYRLDVSDIGYGCYKGHLRGELIFDSCNDGEGVGTHYFSVEASNEPV